MTETPHDGYDRLMADFRGQLREAEKLRAGGSPAAGAPSPPSAGWRQRLWSAARCC